MRFNEMKLEEPVLQGLEAMNFQEATPGTGKNNSCNFRRKRYYRLRTNRNR